MAGLASYYASAGPYMQFKMGQDIMSGESQAMERAMSLRNSMLQQQASEMKIKEHMAGIAAIRGVIDNPQTVEEEQFNISPLAAAAGEAPSYQEDSAEGQSYGTRQTVQRPETQAELTQRAGLAAIKTGAFDSGVNLMNVSTRLGELDRRKEDDQKELYEKMMKVNPSNAAKFWNEGFLGRKYGPQEVWKTAGKYQIVNLPEAGKVLKVPLEGGDVQIAYSYDPKDKKRPLLLEEDAKGRPTPGTQHQFMFSDTTGEKEYIGVHKTDKEKEDPVDKFTRVQGAKDESESRKRYTTAIRDYNREVSQLTGQYNASMRGGVPMTTDDWNSQLKTIEAKYAPAFADRPEGAKWGEPKEAKRNLRPMTPEIQKQIRAKAKTKDEAIKMAEDMGYDPYK